MERITEYNENDDNTSNYNENFIQNTIDSSTNFNSLIDNVLTNFADVRTSLQDLLQFKGYFFFKSNSN
jgi:hypothetical protein